MNTASASSTRPTTITADMCSRCSGGGTCASCAQRRKRAWRLVSVKGLSCEDAAAQMRLTPEQVLLLAEQESDRQDLARYRLNMIPAERVRAFLENELASTPGLNRAEVAHYLNMKQIDLDRQLGYEPYSNGHRQRKVRIEAASRLVIALGRAPHELDGC